MTKTIRIKPILYLTAALAALPSVSVGGLLGPGDYDECILDSMKGVNSNVAARAVMLSCRAKFPEKRPYDAELSAQDRANVTGRAGINYGHLRGHIYNGNSDYTVTQVTIALTPKSEKKSAESFLDSREYNVEVTVPPLTNKDFSVPADVVAADFSWIITKARGYKTQ